MMNLQTYRLTDRCAYKYARKKMEVEEEEEEE